MMSYGLKVFLSVAERGSVTDTANELFVTQPAVSKAIKSLEDKLSLKLFHRDKRKGLTLTDAGRKIFLLARQMRDLEERIYRTAFHENNCLGGTLRIASVPIATTLIVSKVLRRYREKFPAVNIELKEGTPADIRRMLETYAVDFAITYSPFGNFDSQVLFEDEMVGIGCGENFVALRDGVEGLIFCRAGFEVVRKIFNIDARKNFVVQNAETAVKLVEAGNGVGIMSKLVLSTTGGQVNICRVEPPIKMQLGFAAHDLHDLPPNAVEFIRLIKIFCEQINL